MLNTRRRRVNHTPSGRSRGDGGRAPPAVPCRAVIAVPLLRIDPDLPVPDYARPGDAGVDLRARESVLLKAGGHRALVPTGVAVAIPRGYAGFIQPRSGLALTHGITCLNTPGLIDSGYRGELKVLLVNTDPTTDFEVKRGERIAQFVLQAVEHAAFEVVEELPASDRGHDGFGSSGRH
jgi:dUTP pyrophosphatase